MTGSFLRHITFCTAHTPDDFLPFVIDRRIVGYIQRSTLPLLQKDNLFTATDAAVTFAPDITTRADRTRALATAADRLSLHFRVPLVHEIYPVIENWGDEPLAEIDRAAIPWFGTRGFGVHANGYVRRSDGLYIWVATRAMDRRIDPGKRDNIIGGGLPIGYTVLENLAKEAWEEAGINAPTIATAKACGALNYRRAMMKGLRNDTLFQFDLELPEHMIPRNTDGEVERFDLLPAREVADIVANTDDFKFNCNLVMIDFLMRHGVIDPTHPEYQALCAAMAKIKSEPAL